MTDVPYQGGETDNATLMMGQKLKVTYYKPRNTEYQKLGERLGTDSPSNSQAGTSPANTPWFQIPELKANKLY